jgi:orotidine-5'-phosphate decarboxylase
MPSWSNEPVPVEAEAAAALNRIAEHLQEALDVAAGVANPVAQAQVWAALGRDVTRPHLVLGTPGETGVRKRESFVRRVMRGRAAAYRRLLAAGSSYAAVGRQVGETKATVQQALLRSERLD